ncbi:thiamine-phosphate diphosphorylase [Fontimonas thermophila]|uniref:Thiamine-phosphate synthase n=1 Tax=Fontimonas thermophila TaxID=1076937 RepID=A0A1I2JWV6_9GAMM|nr:thiamine phosphate synthase [Fontimonas thermophila]SFF59342.1 thiamine-phosphate diphosphorylase [Fontimonas thermophila]
MTTLRGLYAITSQDLVADEVRLLQAARAALSGGAVLLQYRDKWNPPARRERLAAALVALCRTHGVPLIINDDIDLAERCGAYGVHLGAADGDIAAARARLGPDAIIGATCGNALERARHAVAAGASYVAFGRFFASRTKPDAPPAELATLRAARATLAVPICAIGGITPDNAAQVIAAGADLVAAVEGIFGAPDIDTAARRYAQCFVHAGP